MEKKESMIESIDILFQPTPRSMENKPAVTVDTKTGYDQGIGKVTMLISYGDLEQRVNDLESEKVKLLEEIEAFNVWVNKYKLTYLYQLHKENKI